MKGSPIRVVFDTNIFVAAGFNPRCRSAALVREVRAGRLRLVWNRETRREMEATLNKIPPLQGYPKEGLFFKEGRFDRPTHVRRFTHVPHAADRKFAALATAAKVPLVTRDIHLLGPREKGTALIFTPEEFEAWRRAN